MGISNTDNSNTDNAAATTPWRVTTHPPSGRRTSIFLRARRTNRETGKREEIRSSSYTTDPNEAQRLAEEWEARLNGISVEADPTVLVVVEARLTSMAGDRDVEGATLAKYHRMHRLLAKLPLAGVRASELSRKHLIDARDAIRTTGKKGYRANSTTNDAFVVYSACWRWAQDREMVSVSWPKLRPLDESRPACPKRAYTDHEVAAVLEHIRDREPAWFPAFALLAATGARLNDILSLQGRDVLRTEGAILLRDPKTHEPLAPGVPAVVMALLPEREPDAYLFPSRVYARAGKPVTDSGALRCLRRTLRTLGVPDPEWLDLHSFRRAWCAASEEAGVPRHQAMAEVGHRTGEQFDVYASKARKRKRETAERVHAHRVKVVGREFVLPACPAVVSVEEQGAA